MGSSATRRDSPSSSAEHHVDFGFTKAVGEHNWKLWRSMMPRALEAASTYFGHPATESPVTSALRSVARHVGIGLGSVVAATLALGWCYLLRAPTAHWYGPQLNDALPLDRLGRALDGVARGLRRFAGDRGAPRRSPRPFPAL